MGMSREEFYKRALEAQIRGMMTGEYVGYGSLNYKKKNDFEEIERAFELGYFRKDEEGTPAYGSMNEMLEDLINGKKALALPCPELRYSTNSVIGFNMEALNRYYDEERLGEGLDTEVDMKNRSDLIQANQLREVPEPEQPGLFARFANFLSETFRGRPTETMQNYRNSLAEARQRNHSVTSMAQAVDAYHAAHGNFPGDWQHDSYCRSMHEIGGNFEREQAKNPEQDVPEMTAEERRAEERRLQEERDRREAELQAAKIKKNAEERETRFQNGTATEEDLLGLMDEERRERGKLNEAAGPDKEKLVDIDLLEAVLNQYDTADGKKTFSSEKKDSGIQLEGNQPLNADMLLDDEDDLTAEELLSRTAFAIRVSRAQREAFAEGKEVPLNNFEKLKDAKGLLVKPDESIYNEMSYQLRKGAKQLGFLKDLELPERSPEEQIKFEAEEKERLRQEQILEGERQAEEYRKQHPEQFDLNRSFADFVPSDEEELIDRTEPDVEMPTNPIEGFEEPEEPKSELEQALEVFGMSMSSKENNSYSRYQKDIEALSANPNEAVQGLIKDAKEALDHMALAHCDKYSYTKESAAKDLAALALTHDISASPTILDTFVKSKAAEGYVNRMAKDYQTLVNAGTITKGVIRKLVEKPSAGIHTSLGDNLYQIGKDRKSLSLSDMVQQAIPEYQAQVEKQRVERELQQYPKAQQDFFRVHPIKELKANAEKILPDVSKEYAAMTKKIRSDAEEGKKYILENVVFKKNGTKLDPTYEKPRLEDALIKIAVCQSLENTDYATVQLSLSGNPGLDTLYGEMISNQVKAAGFADEIAKDVTKCAGFVLNPKMNLFDQVEQKNIKAGEKGVTFAKALDEAVETRQQAGISLKNSIADWHREPAMQYQIQTKLSSTVAEINTLSEARETIKEGLADRTKELREKEARIRVEEHIAQAAK